MISRIKVFGERNSGTNFMSALLRHNTTLTVLEHSAVEDINQRVAGLSEPLRSIARERLIDDRREAEFLDDFGWKHAAFSVDACRASGRFDETLFVFVVRNPFSFLRSLYRRPYNHVVRSWPDLHSFLRSPWLCNRRDRLPCPLLETPVELWNLKNRSYLTAVTEAPERGVLFCYEQVMRDPQIVAAALRCRGVIPVAGEIVVPRGPVKSRGADYTDYLATLQAEDPVRSLDRVDATWVLERLDQALVDRWYPAVRDAR